MGDGGVADRERLRADRERVWGATPPGDTEPYLSMQTTMGLNGPSCFFFFFFEFTSKFLKLG